MSVQCASYNIHASVHASSPSLLALCICQILALASVSYKCPPASAASSVRESMGNYETWKKEWKQFIMLLRFKAKQELKESLQNMKYILYIIYLQYRHDKKLFSKYYTLLSKATLATVVSLKKGKTYCTLSKLHLCTNNDRKARQFLYNAPV